MSNIKVPRPELGALGHGGRGSDGGDKVINIEAAHRQPRRQPPDPPAETLEAQFFWLGPRRGGHAVGVYPALPDGEEIVRLLAIFYSVDRVPLRGTIRFIVCIPPFGAERLLEILAEASKGLVLLITGPDEHAVMIETVEQAMQLLT